MSDSNQNKQTGDGLIRRLGLFDSTMMMVGIVIGAGIFLTPATIAKSLPSEGLILIAWVAGGLLVLAGALTFAELGAAMPQAGGQYVYLREAYGQWAGFLFGWMLCLVSMGGAIAAVAVGFATYLGHFIPAIGIENKLFTRELSIFNFSYAYELSMGHLIAVLAIGVLSAVNYVGAGLGKTVQNIITVAKIGTIAVFIGAGLIVKSKGSIDLSLPSDISAVQIKGLIVGFGVAMVAVSFTYDGWHNINYVAGEIKNPRRNLPLTLIFGALILTTLYFLMNLIYVKALNIPQMQQAERVAEAAADALWGRQAANLMAAGVIVSTFGCLNGVIFVAPRVYYAMARDKMFFARAGHAHRRFRTPSFAIVIQGVWAAILALSGSYEQLLTFVTVINLVFWISAAASVFVLRKTRPDMPRPYQTWGYPVVPILFIISLLGIFISVLKEKPVESLAGLGLTLLGVPVYLYWKKKNKTN